MMNVVAVFLLLSSLVTAGFWSPAPPDHRKPDAAARGEEVIVKEGHRVVVVEYEPDTDGNTKVLISPQDQTPSSNNAKENLSPDNVKDKAKEILDVSKGKAKEVFDEAKQKAREAASVLPNLGQGVSGPAKPNGPGPRELVCDAFGKCKNKVTGAIGKAKGTASGVSSRAHEMKSGRDYVRAAWGRVAFSSVVGSATGVVHLLGFVTAYGACVWVTFVSSYVLAEVLPREQFGVVQSKVFPVYFRLLGCSVMVALVGHLCGLRGRLFSTMVGMAQACCLLSAFAMIAFNFLYLEPRATKVMFRRMKLEKEEGRGRTSEQTPKDANHHHPTSATATATSATPGPAAATRREKSRSESAASEISKLDERLKKLNACSSLLNILTLVALTWHLVYLGQRVHNTC